MGAVVAACFASGLDYEDVMQRMAEVRRRDVAMPSATLLFGPLAKSLFSGKRIREALLELVPTRQFSELESPLTVTAVDFDTGQLDLFGAGGRTDVPLIDALCASCALPVYYPPVEIGGRRFVDGGLRAVLPVDVAAKFAPDLIFAVQVGPSFDAEPGWGSDRVPPLIAAHNQAMRTLMAAQADETIARGQSGPVPLVLVEPRVESGATFAVEGAVAYVERGYVAATSALKEWRAVTLRR
jgi:NTE family protein